MKPVELAQIYTDLVNLDKMIPDTEQISKEEIGILRSKYHQLLMDALRGEGIEFHDRFDAMRIAFELVSKLA